jgi:hypothetical protein
MDYADAARWVDIDVTGAKLLELITESGKVYRGGKPRRDKAANWPEARLLR